MFFPTFHTNIIYCYESIYIIYYITLLAKPLKDSSNLFLFLISSTLGFCVHIKCVINNLIYHIVYIYILKKLIVLFSKNLFI